MASRSASILAELRKFPTLDPRAVLAVAAQEGLGGGIGDNGTSFGPWQLHQGGAYPGYAPQQEQAAQQWAWSPAGIDYALRQIASVAGGQRGAQAVASIVHGFERSANQPAEIAGALRSYGAPVPAGNVSTIPGAVRGSSGLWSTASREEVAQRLAGGFSTEPQPRAATQPPVAQINPVALQGLLRVANELSGMFRPQALQPLAASAIPSPTLQGVNLSAA